MEMLNKATARAHALEHRAVAVEHAFARSVGEQLGVALRAHLLELLRRDQHQLPAIGADRAAGGGGLAGSEHREEQQRARDGQAGHALLSAPSDAQSVRQRTYGAPFAP